MNWTPSQSAQARVEGWDVFEVIDLTTPDKVSVLVLATGSTFKHKHEAQVHVIGQAQTGSQLHLSALRAMTEGAA